ncbi:ABC transporter permease [Myroides odoratimimus]|uniref:ABC transporter permease n=1 Tax=Myroides odoratimimus TaxID=76832 RepID=UPI00257552F6|nr:ABC transporter permease [Myroides odoratimimus]MDM1494862.1 ABC transporter permease [Myroides odoratimimus]
MIKNWLKIYWYNTMKHKMYFLLTVIGLVIGLSAVIISYLYYTEEMSYDTWHKDSDRVFMVETKFSEEEGWPSLSYPYGEVLKDISDRVETYSYLDAHYQGGVVLINGESKVFEKASFGQSAFFDVFPFEIVQGNKIKPFDGPNQVFIKDTYVKYLFKDEEPVGQVILLWGKTFTVKGVYKEAETLSSINPNMVFNVLDERVENAIGSNGWGNYSSALWIKLKSPDSKELIEKQLLSIYDEKVIAPVAKSKGLTIEELKKEKDYVLTFYLHDLKGQRLINSNQKNALPEGIANRNRIYIAIGLSSLIMLLSVFNYINITTVQVMNRGKELGVRKVLGANKASTMLQNYFESAVTVLISIIISLVIVEYALPSLRMFFKAKLLFNVLEFVPQVLLFLITVIFLVGTVPAFYISSFKTIEVLKGNIKRSKKGVWFKNTLLTVQFIVACFFIIGSLIVNQQVNYMLNKDLGYNANQIVGVPYNLKRDLVENTLPIYKRLKADILKIKGVEGASAWSLAIGGKNYSSVGYSYQGKQIQAGVAAMDDDFLKLFDIKLKEGRALSQDFASDSIKNVLLNEKAITMMGITDNALGKEFEWNEKKVTIVGVVKDFNLFGLHEDYRPMIFMSLDFEQGWGSNMNEMSIKINTENVKETMEAIEQVWKKHNISDSPFTYEFVDKRFAQSFERSLQERKVFLVLNLLVVFIALFGLYSLASFTINSRLKEVAIRKVLGARPKDLIQKLTGQYIVFCLIGFGIAVFPSYYFLNKWLSDYAFRIEMSVWPFIFCFVIIIILTLLIVISCAFKATRVDVLKYIKYE